MSPPNKLVIISSFANGVVAWELYPPPANNLAFAINGILNPASSFRKVIYKSELAQPKLRGLIVPVLFVN